MKEADAHAETIAFLQAMLDESPDAEEFCIRAPRKTVEGAIAYLKQWLEDYNGPRPPQTRP